MSRFPIPKPPSGTLFRAVARDILTAARADDYPVLVDRGAPAEVVLATLGLLVRVAAERTDAGCKLTLRQCMEGVVLARRDGKLTDHEVATATELLHLARPWRHDWKDGPPIPLEQMFDRAEAWVLTRSWVDGLAVMSAGIQLLQFIESYTPGVLKALADEIEQLAFEAELAEWITVTTDSEEEAT